MAVALGVQSGNASVAETSRSRDNKARTPDDGVAAFMSLRPRLFAIAYRMLRSAAEAEDVVQDVWVRWQTADRDLVRNAAAFLATTTTRVAINVMQSARSRRERYADPGLPEPVDPSADPESGAERGEGLEAGILLLLEKLSPVERAAYILREAFDYTYRDVANALRLGEANARQVVTRARRHLADRRNTNTTAVGSGPLFEAFIAAANTGDVASLEGILCSGGRHLPALQRIATARTRAIHRLDGRCHSAAA